MEQGGRSKVKLPLEICSYGCHAIFPPEKKKRYSTRGCKPISCRKENSLLEIFKTIVQCNSKGQSAARVMADFADFLLGHFIASKKINQKIDV
jgi:hypothetical protein